MFLLWIKFAKLLAVMLYLSGSLGSVFSRSHDDRQRFAYLLAGPGFGLTWLLGLILAGLMARSYLSTWILASMALSFVSLQGVLYVAGKDGRRTAGASAWVLLPLVATTALMVFKPA